MEMKLKADKEKIDAERNRRIQTIQMKVEESERNRLRLEEMEQRMRRTEEIIFSKIKEEQKIKKKKKEKKVKEVQKRAVILAKDF